MNALNVSKYIINYALSNNNPISNLQLQKILYFLDGEYFGITREFLLDDYFVAYPLGPVIESVYQVYKGYGASKIFDRNDGVKLDLDINEQTVNSILYRRVKMSAHDLVDESHIEGRAWDKTVKTLGMYSRIDRRLMEEDFANA